MLNKHHQTLLKLIRQNAGEATQHTFLDSYLGNSNPRYAINAPTLRRLAKQWMKEHEEMTPVAFVSLLTSLAEGKSSTEKCLAGILLDYSTDDQRKFNPKYFDQWLNHLEGWAEVDTVCTGDYSRTEIPENWRVWKKLLLQLSKSKNINKRRASLVLLCLPVRDSSDERIAETALSIIDRLRDEKDIRITKAISWLLRSMIKLHRPLVVEYLRENKEHLPKIAVRETLTKLTTGTKTKRKVSKQADKLKL